MLVQAWIFYPIKVLFLALFCAAVAVFAYSLAVALLSHVCSEYNQFI